MEKRRLTQEVLNRLVANGAQSLIEIGYIAENEIVSGVENGNKIRITGAMFQAWIPRELWERMPIVETQD